MHENKVLKLNKRNWWEQIGKAGLGSVNKERLRKVLHAHIEGRAWPIVYQVGFDYLIAEVSSIELDEQLFRLVKKGSLLMLEEAGPPKVLR